MSGTPSAPAPTAASNPPRSPTNTPTLCSGPGGSPTATRTGHPPPPRPATPATPPTSPATEPPSSKSLRPCTLPRTRSPAPAPRTVKPYARQPLTTGYTNQPSSWLAHWPSATATGLLTRNAPTRSSSPTTTPSGPAPQQPPPWKTSPSPSRPPPPYWRQRGAPPLKTSMTAPAGHGRDHQPERSPRYPASADSRAPSASTTSTTPPSWPGPPP